MRSIPYVKNGSEQHTLELQGVLSIDLKARDSVEFKAATGPIAFIAKKEGLLGKEARVQDVPRPPWPAGSREMRVLIMPKKLDVGPRDACFDTKDIVASEWTTLGDPIWNVPLWGRSWTLTPEWESFKVIVETRQRGFSSRMRKNED